MNHSASFHFSFHFLIVHLKVDFWPLIFFLIPFTFLPFPVPSLMLYFLSPPCLPLPSFFLCNTMSKKKLVHTLRGNLWAVHCRCFPDFIGPSNRDYAFLFQTIWTARQEKGRFGSPSPLLKSFYGAIMTNSLSQVRIKSKGKLCSSSSYYY